MLKLQVTVGPSYDPSTHSIIPVNDDANPLFIDTPHFTGRICVRVKDFKGIVPPETTRIPSSPYFEGNKDQYSIQVQGRFKGKTWTVDDIIFGVSVFFFFRHEILLPSEKEEENHLHISRDFRLFQNDFDRKINLPSISWLGVKVLKWIDPCLEYDIYCDKPWAYSPLFFTANILHVERAPDHDNSYLPSWPSHDGRHIKEGTINSSDDVSTRKKYFSFEENRKKFEVNENQVWNFDFCNPYVDFNNIAVKVSRV